MPGVHERLALANIQSGSTIFFKVFGHHLVPFFYGGVDLPDQSVMAIAQTLSAVFGTRNKSVFLGL